MVKRTQRHPDLFQADAEVAAVPRRRVRWQTAHRLIPTRFPPINLFERIAPPDSWDALIALESLTNPRLRQEIGTISLIPEARRVAGPGASVVMAPFTHASIHRPTRFSDGTYGIYYAAQKFDTALREVAYHVARFHASTNDPLIVNEFRGYQGKVDHKLCDLRGTAYRHLLGPDLATYAPAQRFARLLRQSGADGVVYPSQRHAGGQCIAAFWPDVVSIPIQTQHIGLEWNGQEIGRWFEYATGKWHKLTAPIS